MALFTYDEMIRLIRYMQVDVRMQADHDGKEVYVIVEKADQKIVGEFIGNSVGGYDFKLYDRQD